MARRLTLKTLIFVKAHFVCLNNISTFLRTLLRMFAKLVNTDQMDVLADGNRRWMDERKHERIDHQVLFVLLARTYSKCPQGKGSIYRKYDVIKRRLLTKGMFVYITQR